MEKCLNDDNDSFLFSALPFRTGDKEILSALSYALQYEAIQGMVCLSREELEREMARGTINDGFTLSAYALYRAGGYPVQE